MAKGKFPLNNFVASCIMGSVKDIISPVISNYGITKVS